jgi:tetratricopeptide (TPR) repeat protein
MTHKPEDAKLVELKFNDMQVNKSKLNGDKTSMPPLTHNGHDLWTELEDAFTEKDVEQLRQKLQIIATDNPSQTSGQDDYFNLAEKMDIREFLENYPPGSYDLKIPAESLPKIHLHQHQRSAFETTHLLYEEQHKESESKPVTDMGNELDEGWQEIEEALQEKDIMSLRENLSHLYASTDTSFYAMEDIETYREGKMHPGEVVRFEEELVYDSELKADLRLDMELQEAIAENDIMKLRESLGKIMQNQNSSSRTIEEIESFLDGDMDEETRISFIDELLENKGLRNEIKEVQGVNMALSEKSVIQLRENLQRISREVHQQQHKSVFTFKSSYINVKKKAITAAVIVITFGISALWQSIGNAGSNIYERFYQVPEAVTAYRSYAPNLEKELNKGFEYYQNKNYSEALSYFMRVIESDSGYPVAQFYSGASYQNMAQFNKAIPHYKKVIQHNDNLFMEQATWYSALCYVGIGDKSTAILELKKIVAQNGFYKKDARFLIKKLQ